MRKPIISIIIPCYNCELYIERNIKSILNQTFHEFEIIYINDGSKSWFLILFFGITYGLAQLFTVHYTPLPEIGVLYDVISIFNPANYSSGAFISFIGLGIGALARKFSNHSDEENEK